jgi:hypothetical protein
MGKPVKPTFRPAPPRNFANQRLGGLEHPQEDQRPPFVVVEGLGESVSDRRLDTDRMLGLPRLARSSDSDLDARSQPKDLG